MKSGFLISTCSSGGGSPTSANTTRASDSSGDSVPPSANSATCVALRRPGQRGPTAMTSPSSFVDVSFCWSAESATTTPARKSSSRARSMTVLGTVVTGTPSRPPTCSSGKAAQWMRTPALPDLLPTPGGRVIVSSFGGGPSRLSPWSSAAVSWLTTAAGPRAAAAAAAESSKAPMSRRGTRSARSAVAYIPTAGRTRSPRSSIARICRGDCPAARSWAVVAIPANRTFRNESSAVTGPQSRPLLTFHGCGTLRRPLRPYMRVPQP